MLQYIIDLWKSLNEQTNGNALLMSVAVVICVHGFTRKIMEWLRKSVRGIVYFFKAHND